MAQVPALNSLESCVRTLDRPLVHTELLELHQRMGDDFPLLPLSYFSDQAAMLFADPPVIVKVGSAEAGFGKLKVDTGEQLRDVRSLIAIHSDFVTTERFVEGREYDIRVQVNGKGRTC
jgi:Synapsin, ATP binding domain